MSISYLLESVWKLVLTKIMELARSEDIHKGFFKISNAFLS